MEEAEISRAQDLVYDGWESMAQDPGEAKRYEKAVGEFRELLRRNPNDNQAIRFALDRD